MSKEPLPHNLSPFFTNHPASSAYRITMSPHEWTWTQEEVEAMARALVELDIERQQLPTQGETHGNTSQEITASAGRCKKCGKPTFGLLCAKCKGERG